MVIVWEESGDPSGTRSLFGSLLPDLWSRVELWSLASMGSGVLGVLFGIRLQICAVELCGLGFEL